MFSFDQFSLANLVLIFLFLFFFRYTRLYGNILAIIRYKPIPIPDDPLYSPKDVTVAIPTIDGDGEALRDTIRTCLKTNPYELILVTIDANLEVAERTALSISPKIRVLSEPKANKRRQMRRAIPEIKSEITIFADDDVIWPEQILPWILAPFEDHKMGGVGTSQRLRRPGKPSVWSFLNSAYLERRNWDIVACTHWDGGLPCLSGRTVAYRTKILQDPKFQEGFTTEKWRSHQLNADDDNFLSRWMVNHGWKTYVQKDEQCTLQTTLEDNPKYISQCMRWIRSNWRSNLTSMFAERNIWTRHTWTAYATFFTTLTNWPLIYDPFMTYLLWHIMERGNLSASATIPIWTIWFLHMFIFSRGVKYISHFRRYPQDIVYFPWVLVFGYLHCLLKLNGLLSLNKTAWGSRAGADADDSDRMIRLAGPPEEYLSEKSPLFDESPARRRVGATTPSPTLPLYYVQEKEARTSSEANNAYHEISLYRSSLCEKSEVLGLSASREILVKS
ncbi:glycosyltransferase family 2 protein [Aulographum hederae CBS 113979]|uniref:Glycosyltransferase family 2 protein n=1 Tax=Aulographum hederae CBS 113979 TaxID=1176131 RepID=A0A6G1H5X1_9PEZI|nr:glycosyltransferase family 2 protein [Aulographum hederae CBS 113979]